MGRDNQKIILGAAMWHICKQWQDSKERICLLYNQMTMYSGDDFVDWMLEANRRINESNLQTSAEEAYSGECVTLAQYNEIQSLW